MEETKLSKRPKKVRHLGALHDLMKRGLPDYVDEKGELSVRDLAMDMSVSYQAVYLMFKRNSISKKRIATLCWLSNRTNPRPKAWAPLDLEDFRPFIN